VRDLSRHRSVLSFAVLLCATALLGTGCHHSAANCDGGSCQVGGPCTTNADCAAVGSGAICKLTSPSGVGYPNGYCTVPCSGSNCPNNSNCVDFGQLDTQFGVTAYGENTAFCLAACNWDGDCNAPNYACLGGNAPDSTNTTFTPGFGCFVSPPATTQTGQPCLSVADCAFPPTTGFCFQETTTTGSSGFIGGYCSADCLGALFRSTDADAFCGTNSRCIVDGVDGSGNPNSASCYSQCAGPGSGQSTCRAGYICSSLTQADGGVESTGICYIPCQFTVCATGTTCTDAGYCQ
jgi:hypothetical protein